MSCCKPNPYEEDPYDLSDSVPSHDGSCSCNEGCLDESPPRANYTESSLSVPFKSHRNLCCGGHAGGGHDHDDAPCRRHDCDDDGRGGGDVRGDNDPDELDDVCLGALRERHNPSQEPP